MLSLLQAAGLTAVLWAVWKFGLRHYLRPSSLDNVPGPKPESWIFGSLNTFFSRHSRPFHESIWRNYSGVAKLQTFLGRPMLYVWDPKAMHSIVIKDQYTYEETDVFINFNHMVFGPSLLSSLGNEHRRQRKMLNPVFHINHMRYMCQTFYKVTHKLRGAINKQVLDGPKEIDLMQWFTRTALELLGQGGLGHSFDSLEDDTENTFTEDLKTLIPNFRPFLLVSRFLPIYKLNHIGTPAFRRWVVESIPSQRIKRCLQIMDRLDGVSRDILARKKAALAAGDEALLQSMGEGKDIMSVLLKANTQASEDERMPDDEFLGHMCSLMFAAMDTTSGALARIIHLLAQHPDVQEKLRAEIVEARRGDGDIDYDQLVTLPYLEAVCRESLRLHSPATTMSRQTREDVVMPLSQPIRGKDGTMMHEITVPKGTIVAVGILASNCNEALWGPDAMEWKPERWLKPLPQAVLDAHIPGVYSNLMTFLGGGRACIGFKFSQMEMKIVLSVLLETFKFSPSNKDIYWHLGGLQSPAIGREGAKAQMPLIVERISP
ncbi:cytochrome P450-dit2 [Steccherinum ochraceum]|uniref:Cytochrome P450-dit2 n=1 Tax=Steccherinum ochraceum TaxID=92696 RepID=A0A4R0RQP4_9APHY|nr:cytochrome P450-dit2 [Steccherinum ochraceum]